MMLRIHDLSLVYPDGTRAIDAVTLEAGPGVLGLLGPNGAGKSSLMRVLATLQLPTAGSVSLGELDALRPPERVRRRLGYLPQEFGVYPGVRTRDMLDHLAILKGLTHRATRRQVVDGLLARLNLWDVRDRALASLSGGMRRRFGVAQALIGDPDLLLLDEPSAGLDPTERHRLLDIVAEAGERAVVLLSTHLVDEAAAICPRVAILVDGRLRLDGRPADLTNALRDRVWRRTVARADANEASEGHQVISSRFSAGRTVVRILSSERPGETWDGVEPSLEDVYLTQVIDAGPG